MVSLSRVKEANRREKTEEGAKNECIKQVENEQLNLIREKGWKSRKTNTASAESAQE